MFAARALFSYHGYMNYYNFFGIGGGFMGGFPVWASLGLLILLAWNIVWKGWALWRSAQRREKIWFIVFLIVNTAGILEIIYLFVIAKEKLPPLGSSTKPEQTS